MTRNRGAANKGQAVTAEMTSLRRLNWGCGSHVAPGWLNCDVKQDRWIDVSCDINHGLPFEASSLDYAVSIHALQEIPHYNLFPVLEELRRVLKPGGILRLCLPDFERGLRAYQENDRAYFVVPDEDAQSLSGKFLVQMLWYGWSRTLFTHEYLEELLLRAGFSAVNHCSYRTTMSSEHPEIVELDNREAESLFVEAVK